MTWLTLTVAFIGALVVLVTRPVWGLVAYVGVLLLYPDYVRVSVGGFEVSAARVIVVVLLLRCLFDPGVLRRFQFRLPDALVLATPIVYTASLLCTTPSGAALQNQSGFLLDSVCAYFAVRFTVTDRPALVRLLKGCAVILVLLALLGIIEATTRFSPFEFLKDYSIPGRVARTYEERLGLLRAQGPHSHSIMFGLSLATLLPLTWLLRFERGAWAKLAYVSLAVVALGVLSSLSAGPFLQLFLVLVFLALQRYKHLTKPLIGLAVAGCLAIELLSERRFYYVLAGLAFDPVSGYYRAKLIDVALAHLSEYWTCGYGLMKDPGWGPEIIALDTTDTVNQYIYVACLYGLPGVVAFVAPFVAIFHDLLRGRRGADAWFRGCIWVLGTSLLSLLLAFWTVCVLGLMTTVVYLVLGLGACLRSRQLAAHAAAHPFSRRKDLRGAAASQ